MAQPFILLDDARVEGASDARLYRDPAALVIARRPQEVAPALARVEQLRRDGHDLVGYIAYEAGFALEPRLAPLAAPRTGAAGPLVWFGAFDGCETIGSHDVRRWLEDHAAGPATIGPFEPALSFGGYSRAFAELQEAIRAGDIYQANLTFPLEASWSGDPLALYAAIRPAAAAGYGGMVFDGAHWLLSFSPELFFAIKDGAAVVRPMKGTRPRGRSAKEDAALAAALAASVKDRAENLMIVDLMRNDLARVAEAGSVSVESPFTVETYPTVHQMVSTIRARLQPDRTAIDVIQALFPCGSIIGAPKIRAMELAAGVEGHARGAYCGAIGRIDASGDAAFNVAIRTLRLSPAESGQGRAVLGVGSAIVADSHALEEWRECLVKGGFVRESPVRFDLIESMRFEPETGIALLELHLERIRASASALGFSFDRHQVRNQIQALCFELDMPAKLRLVLARSGAIALEAVVLTDGALPDPALCAVLPLPVDSGDWRLRHKSSDRAFYDAAREVARKAGADEALLIRDDGLLTEASRSNIFVERDGLLVTPPAGLGLLPGVLRRSLLDEGRAVEAELRLDDLARGFFLGNSVRGLMPAALLNNGLSR